MSLAEIMAKYPGKKYHFKNFPAGRWIEVIAVDGLKFWTRNNEGLDIILSGESADFGWTLFLEKKIEKWCAWFHRVSKDPVRAYSCRVFFLLEGMLPENVSDCFRIEAQDFTIEVTE